MTAITNIDRAETITNPTTTLGGHGRRQLLTGY